jgi:hypothetical protein
MILINGGCPHLSIEKAKKAGMKHYIVEVEEFNSTPIAGMKQSLDFLLNADYVK